MRIAVHSYGQYHQRKQARLPSCHGKRPSAHDNPAILDFFPESSESSRHLYSTFLEKMRQLYVADRIQGEPDFLV